MIGHAIPAGRAASSARQSARKSYQVKGTQPAPPQEVKSAGEAPILGSDERGTDLSTFFKLDWAMPTDVAAR